MDRIDRLVFLEWSNDKITEPENESYMWTFTHISDGYFTITSYDTNKYLTVAQFVDEVVELTDTQEGERSLWKPVLAEDGVRMKLVCKNTPNLVLGAGPSSNTVIELEQLSYTSDNEHSDEWSLIKVKKINCSDPIGQEVTNWCWIANAKMFAQNYCNGEISMSLDSACDEFGATIGESGNEEEIAEMIKIFLDSYQEQNTDFNASQFYPTVVRGTYDEDILINILEAGDVIVVGLVTKPIQSYQINNVEQTLANGHFYTITGYVSINGIIYFVALNSSSPLQNISNSNQNILQETQSGSNIDYSKGSVELFSHSKLVDGACALANEAENNYYWAATIICNDEFESWNRQPVY